MNTWDNLPNAKHIDFVIESVKKYPDEWGAAYDAENYAAWNAARNAAWNAECAAALNTAYDAKIHTAYYAARDTALDASYSAARDAARHAAWVAARYGTARDAILSLVAYDDCDQYLDMSYNELLFMAKLTQIPATILLLPYAKAMELIKEKQ